MKVTKAEEYGVRLVMCLARLDRQLSIRDLAHYEGLPQPTVAKVINRLRRGGVVDAVRGRSGGYTLARPAGQITLMDIVAAFDRLMDDTFFCDRMRTRGEACVRIGSCRLRPVWNGLAAVIEEHLSAVTVADLVAGDEAVEGRYEKGRESVASIVA